MTSTVDHGRFNCDFDLLHSTDLSRCDFEPRRSEYISTISSQQHGSFASHRRSRPFRCWFFRPRHLFVLRGPTTRGAHGLQWHRQRFEYILFPMPTCLHPSKSFDAFLGSPTRLQLLLWGLQRLAHPVVRTTRVSSCRSHSARLHTLSRLQHAYKYPHCSRLSSALVAA